MLKSLLLNVLKFQLKNYLSYVFWLFAMGVAILSISTAMFIQYFLKELPCPLCLLQRIGFFGFIFGAMLHFKGSSRFRSMGISLLSIILLIAMSVRQSLLDIYPRPGHAWIGPALFGFHLPVWTFIGCILLLMVIAFEFIFIENDYRVKVDKYPSLKKMANAFSMVAIILCAINLISVILQCGLKECHTFRYLLL